MLHYLPAPAATLDALGHLLAHVGSLLFENIARRAPPFPWPSFEWLVRCLDRGHARAYTLAEARELCGQAGLHVATERAFAVDWLWHAWVVSFEGGGDERAHA